VATSVRHTTDAQQQRCAEVTTGSSQTAVQAGCRRYLQPQPSVLVQDRATTASGSVDCSSCQSSSNWMSRLLLQGARRRPHCCPSVTGSCCSVTDSELEIAERTTARHPRTTVDDPAAAAAGELVWPVTEMSRQQYTYDGCQGRRSRQGDGRQRNVQAAGRRHRQRCYSTPHHSVSHQHHHQQQQQQQAGPRRLAPTSSLCCVDSETRSSPTHAHHRTHSSRCFTSRVHSLTVSSQDDHHALQVLTVFSGPQVLHSISELRMHA